MPTPAREPLIRLGLQIPSFTYPDVPDDRLFERVTDIAKTAEKSGFDSVWAMDHFYQIVSVGQRDEPMFDAYVLLGALAAVTSKVKLGSMVTGVTYRNPAHLAKIVTGLDVISSGRAILGIGAAWNEEEHVGMGFDFPPLRERFERLEEALQICRAMFTDDAPSFSGTHYRIHEVVNSPRPVTPGGPPILVGGSGERKTIPMLARYGDASNFFGDVETIRHKVQVLEDACERIGRDPAEITKTRLGGIVVGDTAEDAERRLLEFARLRGMDEERARWYAIAGDRDSVGEQLEAYLDAGLDGMVFNMHDAWDLERVALTGEIAGRVLRGAAH
jgi:F420-dependent oxidoreductase-like protein